jgi:membrane protein DedA with SNARE-associated domain
MFSILGSVTGLIVATLAAAGLLGLFALVTVANFGIPPLPSEVILPLAGFLVAEGTFPLIGTVVVALVAGLAGSYAGYAVGRWGRERITGVGLGRLRLDASHLERVDRYFDRHGEATVGFLRLAPVLRAYISFPAGTARMDPVRFGVFTFVGSIPYTLALLYAGFLLRSDWTAISSNFELLNTPLLALIAVGAAYLGLLIAGIVLPGWPPRRAPSTPRENASDAPPPPSS